MLQRLLLLFLLIFTFGVSVFSCEFDVLDSTCERFGTPFNEFRLSSSQIDSIVEASIFHKDFPFNSLKVEIEGTTIRNLDPFLEPGVYVLYVVTNLEGGARAQNEFEYIFDNTRPLSPVVTSVEDGILKGKTHYPNQQVRVSGDLSSQITSSETGEFELSLPQGFSFVSLEVLGQNGLNSYPTQRAIHSPQTPFEKGKGFSVSQITIDTLENYNPKTLRVGSSYTTSSKHFYVGGRLTGSNLKGVAVYVNGEKSLADSTGKFGAFTLLNKGANTVEVYTKGSSQNFQVTYLDDEFTFTSFDLFGTKVIRAQDKVVTARTSFDALFDVYLNGEYLFESSGVFTLPSNKLNVGKNSLLLLGPGLETLTHTFFVDIQDPEVVPQFEDSSLNEALAFKITDDTSILSDSVSLTIGEKQFGPADFDIKGDFYILENHLLAPGSYSYKLSASDRVGNIRNYENSFQISSTSPRIEKIIFADDEGFQIGSNLFVKNSDENKLKLILIPSHDIVFDSIILDGVEQTKYSISKGKVELDLEPKNRKGLLELSFANQEKDKFSQDFSYEILDEKISIDLDSFSKTHIKKGDVLVIGGELEGSQIDWQEVQVSINSISFPVFRYGNAFESQVRFDRSSDLLISAKSTVLDTSTQSINFLYDESPSSLTLFESHVGSSFNLGTNSQDYRDDYFFLDSYDGINVGGAYASSFLELSSPQRQGIRTLDVKAQEASGNKLYSLRTYSVDMQTPQVYLVDTFLVVSGTGSQIESVSVNDELVSGSSCPREYGEFECYDIDSFSGVFTIVEESGLISTGDLESLDQLTLQEFNVLFPLIPRIYVQGLDSPQELAEFVIQGRVLSKGLERVRIDGRECSSDVDSFVCSVELNAGTNTFTLEATDSSSSVATQQLSVQGLSSSESSGSAQLISGAQEIEGTYYIHDSELGLVVTSQDSGEVRIFLDEQEVTRGEGSQIIINIDEFIDDSTRREELNLRVVGRDDTLFEEFALIYSKIIEALLNVVIR